jgi:hypothetical protein
MSAPSDHTSKNTDPFEATAGVTPLAVTVCSALVIGIACTRATGSVVSSLWTPHAPKTTTPATLDQPDTSPP